MKCLLGLGSNLKTPARQLTQAIQKLKRLPKTSVLAVAPYYRNPAWGKKCLPDYANTVVLLETTLRPFVLWEKCQQIEQQHHRIRRVRYGARTLDIDVLTYGALRQKHPQLRLPHPQMHQRDFVQVPLSLLE